MRGWRWVGLLSALAVVGVPAGNARADSRTEIQELRQILSEQRAYSEALEKRINELESAAKAHPAPAAAASKSALPARPVYDGGFATATDDGKFSLKLNGLLQTRYTLLAPENGPTSNTFDVQQARLWFSGTAFDPRISYFFQMRAGTTSNSSGFSLLDWWAKYTAAPEFGVTAGRFILPYSRQFQTGPTRQLLVETSVADQVFALGRSVGARVGGQYGKLSYDLAGVNSIRAGDASGQQNFGAEIAGVARVAYDILSPYGLVETSPTPPEDPQLTLGLAGAYNPVDDASVVSNLMPNDRTVNLTSDIGWRWKRASAQAAFYYRRDDLASGLPNLNDWGWYVQAGFYLVPSRWELAARVSGVDFEAQNNPDTNGGQTDYTVGLNYYLYGNNVKLQTDYTLIDTEPFTGGDGDLNNRIRVQVQFMF